MANAPARNSSPAILPPTLKRHSRPLSNVIPARLWRESTGPPPFAASILRPLPTAYCQLTTKPPGILCCCLVVVASTGFTRIENNNNNNNNTPAPVPTGGQKRAFLPTRGQQDAPPGTPPTPDEVPGTGHAGPGPTKVKAGGVSGSGSQSRRGRQQPIRAIIPLPKVLHVQVPDRPQVGVQFRAAIPARTLQLGLFRGGQAHQPQVLLGRALAVLEARHDIARQVG